MHTYVKNHFKRYFGLYKYKHILHPISSPDIRIANRSSGRYFTFSLKIFNQWLIVKIVRRLPKRWIEELDATEDLVNVACADALRDKGLDCCVGLLPKDMKKLRKKIGFKRGRIDRLGNRTRIEYEM